MSVQNSQEISDVKVMLVKGIDGEGIESIEKTGTSGLVDTYTITYTDGAKTTFTVTNGKSISSIEKTSTTGTVDTYTITYNDGSTSTFEVTNGTVASAIAYDNTTSELSGDTVQEAIDEIAEDLKPASDVEYTPNTTNLNNISIRRSGNVVVMNLRTNSIAANTTAELLTIAEGYRPNNNIITMANNGDVTKFGQLMLESSTGKLTAYGANQTAYYGSLTYIIG